jgi:acetyltransferase-like isoleucine patch superfamily enzyme
MSFVVLIAVIVLVVLVFLFYAFGRKLNVFSADFIRRQAGLQTTPQKAENSTKGKLKGTIMVFSVRTIVGLVWSLTKLNLQSESLIMNSFRGKLGYLLRASYWKARLGHLGADVLIDTGAHFIGPSLIFIDDCSWLDMNVILIAGKREFIGVKTIFRQNLSYRRGLGELRIGKFCHIAPNAIIQALAGVELGDCASVAAAGKIYSVSNHIKNPKDPGDVRTYKWSPMVPPEEQLLIVGPIVLKNNSGIGLNAVVLPGVTINENSILAVNCVALHDIPPNTISKCSYA